MLFIYFISQLVAAYSHAGNVYTKCIIDIYYNNNNKIGSRCTGRPHRTRTRREGERRSCAVAAVTPTALGPEKKGRRGIAAVAAAVPTALGLENLKGRLLLLPPPLPSPSRSDSRRGGGSCHCRSHRARTRENEGEGLPPPPRLDL
jgi:hypothetical protein